ncbi:MAG: AI-2E family transporter [Bacilli bacterium]|nr:AI-2E family transporter [Bacilli bacterium]
MKQIKTKKLLNILLFLANILILIIIIKEFKILNFCHIILTLISPLFIGYGIAWLIKPVMFYFNQYFKTITSTIITYTLLVLLLALITYLSVPVIINEIKILIPELSLMYKKINPDILNIDFTKVITLVNKFSINIKDSVLTIFYSLFISFFFLTNHQEVSKFLGKHAPNNLIYQLSTNLRAFVRGTILNTIILFFLALISFLIADLPYAFLFATIISITNIIPYIGPYIGGVPSVIVAFNVSHSLGITILIIIIGLQIVESSFIHPFIMSKAIKINPILIIISLIIFSYFFGIVGMILSTPIVCVIKTLYLYNKEFKVINLQVPGKWFY